MTLSSEEEAYICRNLLGLCPRVPKETKQISQNRNLLPSADGHVQPMIVSTEEAKK